MKRKTAVKPPKPQSLRIKKSQLEQKKAPATMVEYAI
jgi:hypothetical protein